MKRIEDLLATSPVMPVLTIERREDAVPLVQALVRGGISLVEITLRTPVALEAIRAVTAEVPKAVVGAGTVLSKDHFRAAAAAGAAFAISPGATPALLAAGRDSGLPFLPGTTTASEIMTAMEFGYDTVKVFPIAKLGGPDYLRLLSAPLPTARFSPSGGINAETAPSYLALPSVISVGGSWLAPKDAIDARDWPRIEAMARTAAALR